MLIRLATGDRIEKRGCHDLRCQPRERVEGGVLVLIGFAPGIMMSPVASAMNDITVMNQFNSKSRFLGRVLTIKMSCPRHEIGWGLIEKDQKDGHQNNLRFYCAFVYDHGGMVVIDAYFVLTRTNRSIK